MRKIGLLGLVVIGMCALLCNPAWAENNLIRFGPGYYGVVGDFADPPADLDDGIGLFVDYERTITEKFGLDFGYQGAVFELGLFGNQDVDMYALTVRANYYVVRGEGVRFFIYPTIGLVDLDSSDDSESGFAWGAGAGIDVPFGKSKWVFPSARASGSSMSG